MSTEEKVALVEGVWETYGLAPALAAVELPKSTWYYHRNEKVSYEEKYAHLLPALETIAQEHPEYGWPRVTVELREKHGHHVNHKVVQRLLRLWDLRLMRSTRRPKPGGVQRAIKAAGKRANLVAHIEDIEPFQVMYTDFTKLRFADGRQKGYLIPIIGHVSKMVYGWAVGETTDTALALKAWQRARGTLQRLGIRYAGMILHQDQDPVFTSYAWTAQLLRKDGVRLSYALRGAKDNPEMESFNSRFKTEGNSLFLDAPTLADLVRVVDGRMCYHNRERRHSALDYVAPRVYVDQVLNGTGKRL
jgi:transposase InsO family protein